MSSSRSIWAPRAADNGATRREVVGFAPPRQEEPPVTCANCGGENENGRRFCGNCGAPLAVACRACGAANSPRARVCGDCGDPLVAAPPSPIGGLQPNARPAASPAGTALSARTERRHVSVLFADLVGFTTLSEARDSEEVRELLTRYFDACQMVVGRYGGVV